MGVLSLLQNAGALMARLPELRKCSWLQLVILSSATIGAAAATYQARRDWMEAASVGVATFVAQLAHIYSPAPGTVAIPADHPMADAVRHANAVIDRNRHQLNLD
jgi:hypothetical protein